MEPLRVCATELPVEFAGRASGDTHDSVVNAVMVMPMAESDPIGSVVRTLLRAEDDVVDFESRSARTAGDLAAVVVAFEDPPLRRSSLGIDSEPGGCRLIDEQGEDDPIRHRAEAATDVVAEGEPVSMDVLGQPQANLGSGRNAMMVEAWGGRDFAA